jgi:hypothetical protein
MTNYAAAALDSGFRQNDETVDSGLRRNDETMDSGLRRNDETAVPDAISRGRAGDTAMRRERSSGSVLGLRHKTVRVIEPAGVPRPVACSA